MDVKISKHRLPKWKGESIEDSYGGKAILNKNNEPVFAEIYVLKSYEEQGYKGIWVDNFRKRLISDMSLKDISGQVERRILKHLQNINGRTYRAGTWDLLLWKDEELKFVELKRTGKDQIRKTQVEFYERAIEKNYKSEQFEIYEWDFIT